MHPSVEREDRLGKHPFAGFGTVMEDIKRTSYTKKSANSIGISVRKRVFLCFYIIKSSKGGGSPNSSIKVNSVSSLQGRTTSISDGISCKGASLRGASKLTTDKARAIMGLILLSAL